jgi:Reverse transcriptase (RNA-dependent DNA polymerase)
MGKSPTTVDYFLGDYRHTLFPLTTSYFLVEHHVEDLKGYIYKKILDPKSADAHFLPQQRCYAAKRSYYLRRTVKLDSVAEFFIYDVVFRNRKSFRKDHRGNRQSFGYRFRSGQPESPSEAYGTFKKAIRRAASTYKFSLTLDVATYFNAIYHHDLVNCVRELNWASVDVDALGKFLRETNAGRSVDCLPHGLHPCKALGSEFLRFVDNSHKLRSSLMLRFLDDMHLFSDDEQSLLEDFFTIQGLLGEKGLSLNDAKTTEGLTAAVDVRVAIDDVKADLLRLRREQVVGSGMEGDDDHDDASSQELSEEQINYLLSLINSPDVQESDVELVLSLLRDHGEEVLPRLVHVLRRFPGLTKTLYNYARFAADRAGLDGLLLAFLQDYPLATEYQLFWIAKLAEDFLSNSPKYGDILMKTYEHANSTIISRAKVLEIPDRRFGLPDLREEKLRAGTSDWEAWAAAGGTRNDKPAARNHLLSYFANGSQINRLIAECLRN